VKRALVGVGLAILCADLVEDVRIVHLAAGHGWDGGALRDVVGHAIREFLVASAVVAIALDWIWALPLVLGAALHGLFYLSGWFIGAEGMRWTSPHAWCVLADIGWRLGLVAWAAPRVPAFIADLRGGERT
jgi:hypothetical protein